MPYQDLPLLLKGAVFLTIIIVIQRVYNHIQIERKINALGGHAHVRKDWVPLGLSFIYKAVKLTMRYEDQKLWHWMFSTFGDPANPYTVEGPAFGERFIYTADEENIKAMLATQFNDFGKGEHWHQAFEDFLGDSIFVTDGKPWHDARQLIRPQFVKDRVSDLHVFEKHVQTLLPLLEKPDNEPVNVGDLLFRFTLDAATHFLLGASVGCLENPTHSFFEAFTEVQRVQSVILRLAPLDWLLPRKTFNAGLRVMESFIQPFIERALLLPQEELEKTTKSDEGYTFLHALAGYTRDRKVLRDQLIAMLLAGRDTTACTLSWLFYHLSLQPRIVEKMRREIVQQVGLDNRPTYDDLKSMRYLQHTINETLRLYPIVPYNMRTSLKDTTLPRGGGPHGDQPMGLPQGTLVGYSTIILQRRADIYPATSATFADHREFSPERWEHWQPRPWTYIPFSGGPRICIGQQFAMTEIAYTTVRILQTYSRIECKMDKVPKEKAELVLQPSEGVTVRFCKD